MLKRKHSPNSITLDGVDDQLTSHRALSLWLIGIVFVSTVGAILGLAVALILIQPDRPGERRFWTLPQQLMTGSTTHLTDDGDLAEKKHHDRVPAANSLVVPVSN